jgi:hypothetical protein
MVTRRFASFTEARKHLPRVLDAAREGLVTTVTRDQETFVVMSADTRGEELRRLLPARALVVAEGGGWAAFLPGVPVHGDAETFDASIDDLVVALREYAEDWNDRLHTAPNHLQHRSLVELVELSDDAQLRAWLLDNQEPTAAPAEAARA